MASTYADLTTNRAIYTAISAHSITSTVLIP